MFLHVPSFSFIFLHFLSLFFPCFPFFFLSSCSFFFLSSCSFFLGAQNPFFASIASRFPIKASYVKKTIFWAVLGDNPIGPSFFPLVYFFILFFIIVFFFNFFPCFSFFSFVFPFFIFVFLYFLLFSQKKKFLPFHFVSLFSFLGAQNLWRHSKIPWGKVHILSWLYLLCIGSSSLFHVEECTFQ